jgi:tripartite-type tricarboxylate transporter receptor subunit TctC
MKRRDALILGLSCVAAAGALPRAALSQTKYPDRPIKLIIPFTPGALSDAVSRLWADRVKGLLGPVYIENQSGANGLVGGAVVARAQPDGYTLLLGSTATQVVSPLSANPAPYDGVNDFAPISILVIAAIGIMVNPSVPVRNLQELINYAKANPGMLSYGTGGVGGTAHLTGELFKSQAGIGDIVHVPYKGGQMFTDLISGHIPIILANVTAQALELHRTGGARILAVTTPKRLPAAPDIPTVVEEGLPKLLSHNFSGLFAPAGTPMAIVAQISEATRQAMADDEFRQKLIASGFSPYPDSTPEAARRLLEDEIAHWTSVISLMQRTREPRPETYRQENDRHR